MRSSFLRSSSCLLLVLSAWLAGCDVAGALGQASIAQGCAGSTLACQSASDLSVPIAVGASLPVSVDLTLQGGGQPPLELVSTNEGVFTVAEETLTGAGPGIATLLFTSNDAVVLDFVAIWVQAPSGIIVSRLSDDGTDIGAVPTSLGMLVGETIPLAAGLVSASEPLAGDAPTTWKAADPTIVAILDEGVVGHASAVARAAGKTTVTASALGLAQTFAVEVMP